MGIEHVRRVYEELGRDDPMYAVLTDRSRRGNRWDPESFFRTGREEVAEVMAWLEALGVRPVPGRAFDFGSGVGRLTQALAQHFERVVGVDISYTMVEAARRYDHSDGRATFLVNTEPDLGLLESGSFDFVYSSITLQHVPPELAEGYVREFFRILRPGGVAVFQMRNGPRIEPGTLRAWWYRLRREHVRRLWQRLRGRPAYEMHHVARSRVEELIVESGGRLLDVADLSRGRPGRSLRYCAVRAD
jgi:SAM-dependent methyltransferase